MTQRRRDGRYDLRSRPIVEAECECGAKWYSVNAQAVASIHSRKQGHRVEVSVTLLYVYGGTEPPSS